MASSRTPEVIFFDMDHTLLDMDCDVSWKTFLLRLGLAPTDSMETAAFFFRQYQAGILAVPAFLRFQLAEFAGQTPAAMSRLARRHYETEVRPRIYVRGRALVTRALASGRPVALLTATNEVIARPLAEALGIRHLLAARLARRGGRFTGGISGTYPCGAGKIVPAAEFCRRFGADLTRAAYYGDSLTDVPVLEAVGFPVTVNPGTALRNIAAAKGWKVLRFRALEGRPAAIQGVIETCMVQHGGIL